MGAERSSAEQRANLPLRYSRQEALYNLLDAGGLLKIVRLVQRVDAPSRDSVATAMQHPLRRSAGTTAWCNRRSRRRRRDRAGCREA